MGVYLSGINMPDEENMLVVQVSPSGEVYDEHGIRLGITNWAEAVPIPEHGRLIDADEIKGSIRKQTAFLRLLGEEFAEMAETLEKGFLQEIDNAPTIIPAEPKEEETK